MKSFFVTLIILAINQTFIAQTPKIYINLASHNEMNNEFYDTDQNEFDNSVFVINQILNHVTNIDARWNFQTCSKFVLGALNWDSAATSSTDVLERLQQSGKVEIDPRNKTLGQFYTYNISDVYHLLDSCGVTSTHTVGGFLHYPFEIEDWTQFRNPIYGSVYGFPWQANIIWGGGSQDHDNDANNYGVWKPKDGDSETNFYTHEETANLWLVGNGCAPVIRDTTVDVQWIVNLIRDNVQKIQNGSWPNNKFYSLTVMTNVRDLDTPGYFVKVRTVLDSIDEFVTNGDMEWATISQKLSLFEAWSDANIIPYSQWTCEEASAGEIELSENKITIYPNPTQNELFISDLSKNVSFEIVNAVGKIVNFGDLEQGKTNQIDMKSLISGVYFVRIENNIYKILKE